jgi:hypothetical protein
MNHSPALCTMPKQPVNTIHAPLTVQPVHLVRLARFCDWTIRTVCAKSWTAAPARKSFASFDYLPITSYNRPDKLPHRLLLDKHSRFQANTKP